MSTRIFATAQDAEAAFYEALERADLDAMMEVWAEDEEIVCVHPAGPRLAGLADVRASWARIFSGGVGTRVQITQRVETSGMMFAVHSLHENFAPSRPGEQAPPPVAATNVYLRGASGWRMVVHHASPVPAPAAAPAAPRVVDTPKTLH